MDKYILGFFVNDEGDVYCTVYDKEMPEEKKNKMLASYNSRADVWNQIFFCSKQYFEQQKQAGWAR